MVQGLLRGQAMIGVVRQELLEQVQHDRADIWEELEETSPGDRES